MSKLLLEILNQKSTDAAKLNEMQLDLFLAISEIKG